MNITKLIVSSIAAVFASGCCNNPFTFHTPIEQLTYCNFKKIHGLSPSPDNIRAWVREPDTTNFRIIVTHRVLLYGMRRGGAASRKRYAEVYLEVYSGLVHGEFEREFDAADIHSEGLFLGIKQNRKVSSAWLIEVYRENIERKLSLQKKEGKRTDPYDWLIKEMTLR